MCDALIPDDSNYCNKCGNPVTAAPIDQSEAPPQQSAHRFHPFQDRLHGSRVYQADLRPALSSAQTEAWAEGISILESDMRPRRKPGGWLKNLKDSIFSRNAAAPVAFELNPNVPSQTDVQWQSFAREAKRPKPHYYSPGKRAYERKR